MLSLCLIVILFGVVFTAALALITAIARFFDKRMEEKE